LERARKFCPTLVGVNNRDLKTFHEDLATTERLAARLPPHVTLVAESAIRAPEDVDRMGACGASAVLVGEGLVRSTDIGAQVQAFCGHPRTQRKNQHGC
jgi:indole-3-glycerol phosphate synthase